TLQPVKGGFVNLANGNLHFEIPLGSFPQKGSTPPLTYALVYDSRIWYETGPSSVWTPQNVTSQQAASSWGGWRLMDSVRGSLRIDTDIFNSGTCGNIEQAFFFWNGLDGNPHTLAVSTLKRTDVPPNPICSDSLSGSGMSVDS